MGTTTSAGAAPRSVGLLLAGALLAACTAAGPPPAVPGPITPAPSRPVPQAPAPQAPLPPGPGTTGLADPIDAFLGASRWGRYDRVSAVRVVVDGQVLVDRRRADLPEQRREVSGVTAAVVVALVGIVLDRADPAHPVPGGLGSEGLGGVRRPVGELVPGPLPEPLAAVATTPLHDLLVGTSAAPVDELAALLTVTTGRPVPELARELLFAPLGIDPPWTAGGPALTAAELTALGALWLDRGAVGDRQVVPAAWVDLSARPHTDTGRRRLPYAGYRLWVTRAGGHAATVLTGEDGQLVEVVPGLDLVVAVTSEPDPDPEVARPAGSEAFVELVSSIVVPVLE